MNGLPGENRADRDEVKPSPRLTCSGAHTEQWGPWILETPGQELGLSPLHTAQTVSEFQSLS